MKKCFVITSLFNYISHQIDIILRNVNVKNHVIKLFYNGNYENLLCSNTP